MAARPSNRVRTRGHLSDADNADVIDLRETEPSHRRNPSRLRSTGPGLLDPSDLARPAQLRESKYFGSPAFMRLWFSQALSSLGDWIGLVAITALAGRIAGPDFAGGAIALVIGARILPNLFLAPFVGVIMDRWDRKTIMVASDIGRGLVFCVLPFVTNLPALILVSFLLEALTMMWSPAKEASVPNLVRRDYLPTANSMSLAAAYGMFVPATLLYAVLAKVPEWSGQVDTLRDLNLTPASVALYFDALTYFLSAAVIATLVIPQTRRKRVKEDAKAGSGGGMQDAKEGWRFVRRQPRVRAVILGMGLGLIGGASVVPLGLPFAVDVLGAGDSGYSLLLTAMGIGVAAGVLLLTVIQKRVPHDQVFVLSAFGCGGTLIAAASMNGLLAAAVLIGIFGICAGALYVLGITILQTSVTDAMRGRVFVTFYTSTRLCILVALVAAPLLSIALGKLGEQISGGTIDVAGISVGLHGARLTLWIGGLIVLAAGCVAANAFRRPIPAELTADS